MDDYNVGGKSKRIKLSQCRNKTIGDHDDSNRYVILDHTFYVSGAKAFSRNNVIFNGRSVWINGLLGVDIFTK